MPESPMDRLNTLPSSFENQSIVASMPCSPHTSTAWDPITIGDIAAASATGQLLHLAMRRVAQLSHPVEEMQAAHPVTLRGSLGQSVSFTPLGAGSVLIEAAACRSEIRIAGLAELRAYAQVLTALANAYEADNALSEFNEEAGELKARVDADEHCRQQR